MDEPVHPAREVTVGLLPTTHKDTTNLQSASTTAPGTKRPTTHHGIGRQRRQVRANVRMQLREGKEVPQTLKGQSVVAATPVRQRHVKPSANQHNCAKGLVPTPSTGTPRRNVRALPAVVHEDQNTALAITLRLAQDLLQMRLSLRVLHPDDVANLTAHTHGHCSSRSRRGVQRCKTHTHTTLARRCTWTGHVQWTKPDPASCPRRCPSTSPVPS